MLAALSLTARALVAPPRHCFGRGRPLLYVEADAEAQTDAAAPAPAPAPVPFDIERRVLEAKGKLDEERSRAKLESIRGRRERRKDLLRSVKLAKLRQRLSAFGFSEVDEELGRASAARRAQDSFGDVDLSEKASWLGPLAEGLLPPRDGEAPAANATARRRASLATGLKVPPPKPPRAPRAAAAAGGGAPSPAAAPAPPAPPPPPPVAGDGLRPVPPKLGAPAKRAVVPLPTARPAVVAALEPSDAPSADRNRTDPVLQTAEVRAAPPDADPDSPPGTEQGKRAAFSAFLGRLRPGPRGGGKPHLSTRSSFGRRGG